MGIKLGLDREIVEIGDHITSGLSHPVILVDGQIVGFPPADDFEIEELAHAGDILQAFHDTSG